MDQLELTPAAFGPAGGVSAGTSGLKPAGTRMTLVEVALPPLTICTLPETVCPDVEPPLPAEPALPLEPLEPLEPLQPAPSLPSSLFEQLTAKAVQAATAPTTHWIRAMRQRYSASSALTTRPSLRPALETAAAGAQRRHAVAQKVPAIANRKNGPDALSCPSSSAEVRAGARESSGGFSDKLMRCVMP